jgi:hypothetical protein
MRLSSWLLRVRSGGAAKTALLVNLLIALSVIAGLAAVVYGGVLLAGDRSFAARAVGAEGTVVAVQAGEATFSTDGSDTSIPYTDARISFVTSGGRRVEFESGETSGSRSVGDRVRVLYEPASPSDARLGSLRDVWSVGSSLTVVGLLELAASVILLVVTRSGRARPLCLERLREAVECDGRGDRALAAAFASVRFPRILSGILGAVIVAAQFWNMLLPQPPARWPAILQVTLLWSPLLLLLAFALQSGKAYRPRAVVLTDGRLVVLKMTYSGRLRRVLLDIPRDQLSGGTGGEVTWRPIGTGKLLLTCHGPGSETICKALARPQRQPHPAARPGPAAAPSTASNSSRDA